jgi:hypothetical protein
MSSCGGQVSSLHGHRTTAVQPVCPPRNLGCVRTCALWTVSALVRAHACVFSVRLRACACACGLSLWRGKHAVAARECAPVRAANPSWLLPIPDCHVQWHPCRPAPGILHAALSDMGSLHVCLKVQERCHGPSR